MPRSASASPSSIAAAEIEGFDPLDDPQNTHSDFIELTAGNLGPLAPRAPSGRLACCNWQRLRGRDGAN